MIEAQNGQHDLVDRLRVIEAQPLAARPEAYVALHEELARRLDKAPAEPPATE